MNIDWVIPCRFVEVHDNLGTLIGAGVDTYAVESLPIVVPVVTAIRLLAVVDELGDDQEHLATNRVRDPRGDILVEVGGPFTVEGESARPEWLAGIMVTSVVQFEAAEEGTYTIEHEVDDSVVAFPVHVVVTSET